MYTISISKTKRNKREPRQEKRRAIIGISD